MDKTQFAIFELTDTCNLAHKHDWCPAHFRPRTKAALVLTPKVVCDAVTELRKRGFDGYVGFHYYNEPLLMESQLTAMVDALAERIPEQRLVLWTNGCTKVSDENLLKRFNLVVYSDYTTDGHPPLMEEAIQRLAPAWHKSTMAPDKRLTLQGEEDDVPCLRPYVEFIVDCLGYGHLCCYDWQGRTGLGHIIRDGIGVVVDRYLKQRTQMVTGRAPTEWCRCCQGKHDGISCFDIVSWAKAEADVLNRRREHVRVVREAQDKD